MSTLLQIWMPVCGVLALWMATGTNPTARRWACAVGLLGQPAWFAFAIGAQAWGLVALCAVYTLVYLRGLLVALRRG